MADALLRVGGQPVPKHQSLSPAELIQRGACLGVLLGYNFGNRISNLTPPEGRSASDSDDHALRLDEIVFSVGPRLPPRLGQEPEERLYKGEAARAALVAGGGLLHVTKAVLQFLTTKTQAVPGLEIVTSTGRQGRILAALESWVLRSGVRDGDPLLTRYANGHRYVIRRRDLTRLTQLAASMLGLPVQRFSFKSLRVGLASVDGMSGATKDRIGGWSNKAGTRAQFYDKRMVRGRSDFDDTSDTAQSLSLHHLQKKAKEDTSRRLL